MKQRPFPDPLVKALTKKQVKKDIAAFLTIIDSRQRESRLHEFLASHSYFFNNAIRLFGYCPLYSKIKLGHNYEVDFAWFDTGSDGPEWNLVEIESPTHSMFKKSGEPTAAFNHAIQQVRDWHSWIHDNISYARQLMPSVEYPLGYVCIGRRDELASGSAKKKLRRIAYENRMFLEIHTLDWFVSGAKSVLNLISSHGASWPLPMKALKHADLARGLPEAAEKWVNLPSIKELLKDNRKLRLQERKYYYKFIEE